MVTMEQVSREALSNNQVDKLPWITCPRWDVPYDCLYLPNEYYIHREQGRDGKWYWVTTDGGDATVSEPFDSLIEVNTRIHYLLIAFGYKETNDIPTST